MNIFKRFFSFEKSMNDVARLTGTTLRSKYGKNWGIRHVALHSLGINVDLCKSDEFFERIMGVTPTTYLIYRESKKLFEMFSDDYNYVCIYYTDKKFMRFINKVNFTFIMDVKKGKKKSMFDDVTDGFKKLSAYINEFGTH
jgi:hypothetical protein